jgi:Flp pilus assembly protein TadG
MKHIKNERGQSLVEMAISITFILFLLAGAVEFGIAFFQFVQLRDAAQEGALYGSITPYVDSNGNNAYDNGEPVNQAGVATRVRAASNSPIDLTDTTKVTVTVSVTPSGGKPCEGMTGGGEPHGIRVQVSFNHQVFMPFMSALIGNSIPLNAEVTDTILSPKCP